MPLTTLLKALSGAGGSGGISISGDILYNGEHLDEFQPRRTSAYIDEIDLHQVTLGDKVHLRIG